MRLAVLMIITVIYLCSDICYAQDRPALGPTRDVTVTYKLTGATRQNGAAQMKISYADHFQRVRVDFFSPQSDKPFGSIIYDAPANRILTLVPGNKIYYKVPATGRANPGVLLSEQMKYTRGAEATVLGLQCTEWQVSNSSEYQGTACVTTDGIALRAVRTNPKPGLMEALAVDYGTPPNSIFEPDPNLQLAPNSRPVR